MTPEEARKTWFAFLREPGRKKHTGELESVLDNERRCCLGHACHVLGANRTEICRDSSIYYGNQSGILPDSIAEMLDMDAEGCLYSSIDLDGDEEADGGIDTITALNDDTDLNPAQIADVLEKQFERGNVVPYRKIID